MVLQPAESARQDSLRPAAARPPAARAAMRIGP